MGFLKPAKWLGRLLYGSRRAANARPSVSTSAQPTNIAAFPSASQAALRRLVSYASLCECREARQGVTKTTALGVQRQPAIKPPRRRGPSVDLQQFTRSEAAGREPYSEDIANRNILAQQFYKGGPSSNPLWRPVEVYQTYATHDPRQLRKRIILKARELQRRESLCSSEDRKQPRDADVGPWTPRSSLTSVFSGETFPKDSGCGERKPDGHDANVVHASIIVPPSRRRSLSHKQSIPDLRLARALGHKRSQTFPGANRPKTPSRRTITRADLDKPLPPLPRFDDTTVSTEWAPAVTHQTVRRDVHEIHQEHVLHDFHQDEFEHRVLPVVDQEVLPARHFVQLDGGGLEELAEEAVGELPHDLQRRISEAAATIFPTFRDSGVSFLSMDGSNQRFRSSERNSATPEGHARGDTICTYQPTFLPSRHGSDKFHRLFVNVDREGKVGSTHARSFSDGPPLIPPRGIRQAEVASIASLQ